MEIWTFAKIAKKTCQFLKNIFPTASFANVWKVIYFIFYFGPTTPTQGSTNHTPALDSRGLLR